MTLSKRSPAKAASRKSAVSTSKKDRDKRFGGSLEDPRGMRGKTGREDIHKETRRVNVPRQSKRPGERSR